MFTVEDRPVVDYSQSVISRLTPLFDQKEILNELNYKNFVSIPLAESISQIDYRGELYQVAGLGLQGFVGEEGFVKSPQERNETTIYFPLFGMAELVRDREIKTMVGCFTDLEVFKNNTQLYMVADKGDVTLIAVISDESRIQVLIPPVVIKPGAAYKISWKSKKDQATSLKNIQPFFLAMSLKLY